ncbi:MAG: hypothetical protein H7A00_03565 [Hahellaceae bacterium]|nr:hypothetical protein [Hahellaceae bacterium]
MQNKKTPQRFMTLSVLWLSYLLSGCQPNSQIDVKFDACTLSQQGCRFHVSDDSGAKPVVISIDAEKIEPLKPFTITISDPLDRIDRIESRLTGVGMEMGSMPIRFETRTPHLWQGKAATTVCSVDQHMRWGVEIKMVLKGNVSVQSRWLLVDE